MSGSSAVPVITIDGPSGAGKGTVALALANHFGFHLLDSGAVYRAAAIITQMASTDVQSESDVLAALDRYHARFQPERNRGVSVFINEKDVTDMLRTCLLYTSPSPRDLSTSRMPSSA